jgi:hypothetical protein
MYKVIDEIYIHDKCFMDLAITARGLCTIVYKKVKEPNIFKDVINVQGDHRQAFINECKKRM